jgi:TorA maturation chaperone TorD
MDDDVYAGRLDLLRFLSALLDGPPDDQFVRGLLAGDVAGPAPSVNDSIERGFSLLAAFHDDRADADPGAVERAVAAEYAGLFETGTVATRESAYREDAPVDRDLAAAYDAADWSPPSTPLDGVGVELAFLRHLVARQREGETTALDRESQFLDAHLSRWLDRFADDLADAAESDLYRGAAHVLRGVVEFEDTLVSAELRERSS